MKKVSDTYKELGIAFTFPIEIKDANGNVTYYEDSDGFWNKLEYDASGNVTYYEDSDGYRISVNTIQRVIEPTTRIAATFGASVNTMPTVTKPTTRIAKAKREERHVANRVLAR